MNKRLSLYILALALSGCSVPKSEHHYTSEKYPVETVRRVPIASDGDFNTKILSGAEFNRIIAKKIESNTWRGYVVHTQTYAPYNNSWTRNGLSIPSSISKSGTYMISGFMEGLDSPDISSKDMAGWYGFHVNRDETTKHGGYVGINAFGVAANVEVLNTRGSAIVLGTTQLRKGSMEHVWADLDVIGSLPNDVNINDLRIEYLARVTGIGNKDYTGSNSPTLSNPSDSQHVVQIYKGELIAARLINAKTKKVYPVRLEWVFRTRDAFHTKGAG